MSAKKFPILVILSSKPGSFMQSIVLQNISKKIGGRVLFDDVTATFSAGNRYGLTGPNGAGKSTLMKIIMGREDATTGSVTLPSKVGYLRQDIEHFHSFRVLDTVIMGNERLAKTLQERDKLYEQEITNEIGMRLGELEGIIAEEDGYTADTDAEILLIGSGIPAEFHQEFMKNIPTDLQFRVLVCQALFGKPEALLLDEPTNHLDMDSIGWLETFLSEYRGVCIVISHDRHFLNTVTTHIADIDYDTIIIYPGNYDAMVVAKTSVRERAEDVSKSREKKISQLKEFVAKFSAGTRASQVQSRLREISKLQPQELKKSNIQRPYISFLIGENNQPGRVIFKVENISKAYIDHEYVIKNFSLEVLKNEKIGIIGHNGQGKSTLLKMLAKKLTPSAGSIEVGHNVEIGYFPQNHDDIIDKREKISLFDWLKQRHPKIYDQEIRSMLGKMLFSGEDAFKHIASLSGGETARLLLGNLILQNPNTLLLDEPNNHLDLEAVSALAGALAKYPGTAIIASHDRDLLDQFATKLIILENHKAQIFSGGLEEYFSTLV